ncbi:methyltransferase domain-containing protein [Nocardioides sp. SYSU D00038]|uniref:methyltransferase domain-containing protein n=1 Tax=Nocardioides sp. SYSU D00038 TaxID=2812554 RepID=UPI0027DD73A2|nr:methyltransferase domain-containing protein [Nocardioides sp. SYSU D00038]
MSVTVPDQRAGRTTTAPPEEVIDFGGLMIRYDERVLRPRPWTSAQSRWAADLWAARGGRALELCTGAGHIGLLAAHLTGRPLVAVDVDPVACAWARHNAAVAGLDRVEVREGDMREAVAAGEQFTVVIADPPWVLHDEVDRFPEDPLLAIDGGTDGLDLARMCTAVMSRHLAPGGTGVLQLGDRDQVEELSAGLDDLAVVETRVHPRGVLVRLDRR